jgi:DHA1 family bicyclomycin/chloramphenicol resistance-like MFS transporter
MSPHGTRAGAASALFGTLQFGLAAVSSFVVAEFARPGPLPMAGVIFACAVLALGFNLSTQPKANPPSPT